MGARRFVAFAAALATASALLWAPPAFAAAGPDDGVSPADPRPPAVVSLEGLVRVVPVEAPPVVLTTDELDVPDVPGEDAPGTDEVEVTLFTDDGAAVDLTTGDDGAWGGAASGARFEGSVAVPEEIADAVAERVVDEALVLDEAETAALVAEVAAEQDIALAVVDASLEPPEADQSSPDAPAVEQLSPDDAPAVEQLSPDAPVVLAAAAPREHVLDVMWVAQAGQPAPSAADLQATIARLSDFWNTESNGQIPRVLVRGAIQFRTVSFSSCDPRAAWTYAAGQFGRTEQSYWSGTSASHLVVLADAALCGPASGLGTYGASIHSGGLVWGTIERGMPREWDQVLFHEFGHNIGLPHSGARVCASPKVDSAIRTADGKPSDPDCEDIDYRDRYDVMGGGAWLEDSQTGERIVSTMRDIAALSVTHKAKLDALPRGSALRTLSIYDAETLTIELTPISAAGGTRGLELIDPFTQEALYVEYRAGTGRDEQSLYAQWPGAVGTAHYAPGVRVLRSYPDSCALRCRIGSSMLLQRHVGAGVLAQWLGAGDALTSYTGGVTVQVIAATAERATVAVTFSDGLQRFALRANPTVAGVGRYGNTLSVAGVGLAAWSPHATGVQLRWLRNGVPIPGATRSTYTLDGADIGATVTARVIGTRPGFTPAVSDSAPIAVTGPVVDRISGATRYETAVEVSRRAFLGTAPVVYLATGANYPDALAAAPAAAVAGGPLLLVPPAGAVPAAVLTRIAGLAPSKVIVVGGASVVSDAVVAQVRARVPSAAVERHFGANRYETARELVDRAFEDADDVYVATGRNYPDALSAAAVAGGSHSPVLLVDGLVGELADSTRTILNRLAPDRIFVVGGTGVVSAGIAADLTAIAPVSRLAGSDRFATSAAVNAQAFPSGPVARQYWATGLGFPDALSGASLAAVQRAPLFVVRPACVPPVTAAETGRTAAAAVTLIGGTGVLSGGVAALRRC